MLCFVTTFLSRNNSIYWRVLALCRIVAAKRLFKIWRFTIGAPRAVIVKHLRGSLRLSKKFEATYNFFENFCEFVVWLEKPKSGEISDVLVLKVGDRGATATPHTPYFHDSLYRLGWIVIRKSLQIELWSCIIVLPYGGACLEPPHASRPPAISWI